MNIGWCLYEGGVRELGRCFEKIARKYAVEVLNKIPENQDLSEEYPLLKELESQTTEAGGKLIPKPEEALAQKKENNDVARQLILKSGVISSPVSERTSSGQDNSKGVKIEDDTKAVRSVASEQVLKPRMFKIPEHIKKLNFAESGVDSLQLLKKYLGSPYFDFDLEQRSRKRFSLGNVTYKNEKIIYIIFYKELLIGKSFVRSRFKYYFFSIAFFN
jgi:ATP-dependent Lon protease